MRRSRFAIALAVFAFVLIVLLFSMLGGLAWAAFYAAVVVAAPFRWYVTRLPARMGPLGLHSSILGVLYGISGLAWTAGTALLEISNRWALLVHLFLAGVLLCGLLLIGWVNSLSFRGQRSALHSGTDPRVLADSLADVERRLRQPPALASVPQSENDRLVSAVKELREWLQYRISPTPELLGSRDYEEFEAEVRAFCASTRIGEHNQPHVHAQCMGLLSSARQLQTMAKR